MEALDDLINERGFKQGQSVKLNYNDIVELVNQRVMENINFYLEIGWWIQVSPLAEKDSGWICGIYKRGAKTGNWSTQYSKKFKTPSEAYAWGDVIIDAEINKEKETL